MRTEKFKLKTIAKVGAGNSAPDKDDFSDFGIPFIRAGSLAFLTTGESLDKCEKIDKNLAEKNNLKLFPKNSILFAKSGMSAKMGRVYELPKEAYVVSHLAVIQPNADKVNPSYLKYFLLYRPPFHLIKDDAYPSIKISDIEELEIDIPDIETQNKIVAILDKASSLITKREECISMLDELLRATFLDMFGDPISNAKNWYFELLGDIAKLERGRFSPRPRNDPSYFGGEYPFIQTGDINNSRYRLKIFTQTLNEKGIKVSKKFHVGDIVIAIVGATIGATSILQIDAYATDSIIAIKSIGKTNNVFLEMLLRFYRQVLLDTAPEAARANINLSILGKLKIITPPIELQNKYLEIDKRLEAETERFLNSLEQLEQLQKSIIQKVFKGQLNFNVDFELDSLIQEIDLQKKENDLSKITRDIAYLQRLVDKLNSHEFKEKDLYDKAKHAVFQLVAVKDEERKVIQKYNEKTKSIQLALK